MRKIFILLAILVFGCKIVAQNKVYLKVPLSQKDTLYLKAKLREYYNLNASVNFSFHSFDVSPPKNIKPEKPFDLKQVEDLKKKLKGNYDDADIYLSIGYLYKYNYDFYMFRMYLNQAIELYKERVENKPDSASSYDKLGNAYYYNENYKEAIQQYEKAIAINPHDTSARFAKVISAFSAYDMETTLKFIKENIVEMPDNIDSYVFLPMYYMFDWMQKAKSLGNSINMDSIILTVKNKMVDEIFDISLVKTAFETHKNDIRYELLYNISRQSVLLTKVFTASANAINNLKDTVLFKFSIDKQDSAELNRLEHFYYLCEKRKDVPNKYGTYKWLASVYYMKGDYKQAAKFLHKAIEQKPISKSTFEYNAQGDYLNLAGIYLLHHDTANYEKTIAKKFKLKPGINEVPDDYVLMGKIAFYHKDYQKAKQYGISAMTKHENLEDAYMLLCATEIESGNVEAALRYLDKAYKLKPDDNTIFLFAAIGNLLKNDVSNANMFFEKAIELGSDKETIDKEFINKFFILK